MYLVLYYVGFGYVLFLLWVVLAVTPSAMNTGAAALTVLAVAHPAAALAAWDLRRQLAAGSDAPPRPTVAGLLPVLASLGIAAVAIVLLA